MVDTQPGSVDRSNAARLVGRKIPLRFNSERNIVFINPTFPDLPPLVLDVNPDTISKQFQKSVNTTHSRGAVFVEHWGTDQLTQLTASGSTMGFGLPLLRDDPNVASPPPVWELQAGYVRHQTLAAENFHHLLQLFLNGGSEYNPRTGQPDTWQELMMWFAGELYLGYFSTLDFEENADSPFRWQYNFSFTVTGSVFSRGNQTVAQSVATSTIPTVTVAPTDITGAQ